MTCGKGTKTKTRQVTRPTKLLYGIEVDKYRLSKTTDCYEDPCLGGKYLLIKLILNACILSCFLFLSSKDFFHLVPYLI